MIQKTPPKKTYYIGKPCGSCGGKKRYEKTGRCVKCNIARNKERTPSQRQDEKLNQGKINTSFIIDSVKRSQTLETVPTKDQCRNLILYGNQFKGYPQISHHHIQPASPQLQEDGTYKVGTTTVENLVPITTETNRAIKAHIPDNSVKAGQAMTVTTLNPKLTTEEIQQHSVLVNKQSISDMMKEIGTEIKFHAAAQAYDDMTEKERKDLVQKRKEARVKAAEKSKVHPFHILKPYLLKKRRDNRNFLMKLDPNICAVIDLWETALDEIELVVAGETFNPRKWHCWHLVGCPYPTFSEDEMLTISERILIAGGLKSLREELKKRLSSSLFTKAAQINNHYFMAELPNKLEDVDYTTNPFRAQQDAYHTTLKSN